MTPVLTRATIPVKDCLTPTLRSQAFSRTLGHLHVVVLPYGGSLMTEAVEINAVHGFLATFYIGHTLIQKNTWQVT